MKPVSPLCQGQGGAGFPIAALISRRDLDAGGKMALGHCTQEKSPAGCAAAPAAGAQPRGTRRAIGIIGQALAAVEAG